MNSKAIDELLAFDSLQEAEKITGKDSHDDEATTMLGLVLNMNHADATRKVLKSNDDTPFSCPLNDYLRIAASLGLRTLLDVPFVNNHGQANHFYIMWSSAGYLLAFDTYYYGKPQQSVNGGKLYYNLDLPEEEYLSGSGVTSSGGYHKNADGTFTWAGDHDCREALRHKINKLNPFVLPVWKQLPWLWLLHHGDDPADYKAITRERLVACEEPVKHILELWDAKHETRP